MEKIFSVKLTLSGKQKIFRLKIAPSTIPNAGMGVFAVDRIPKGAKGKYKGKMMSVEKGDPFYSWVIYEYDKNTGVPLPGNKELYLLDAHYPSNSNWTRYVNCGIKNKFNNIDVEQSFDQIYYFTKREIKPGEELFVDYGPEYRKVNLGLKGRY
jgi:hypothetical protein